MKNVRLVGRLLERALRESLAKIDPTGKMELSEFRVISSSDLVIGGLLEGVNFVGFAIGDSPELIMAFDFENSSTIVSRLLKLKKTGILETYNIRELMESLLRELGNVIAGQFASRLSNSLGYELLPSVPFSIKTVDQLERVLNFLGGGKKLPVFVGLVYDEHGGCLEVYIIPSADFFEMLARYPEPFKRTGRRSRGVEYAR
ncbi:chemotaxis protein CheC [Thermococcus gammatolerans]|uniref:Chemotaxis protein CheC-like protein (CheC) n=1 Tax=Thermococcus gammatolerans (strain DSM 15229 / JCM 11827 / EJ3) TaxID=593117 RepID=C5A718_THEGJ|nr:chemotaxis protein CheC [Thermococcus gammatolerans]ACS34030.1 Chemotaxis protein CheC-like protein (cheC) [Thermococcus gammatolerans EJ3]